MCRSGSEGHGRAATSTVAAAAAAQATKLARDMVTRYGMSDLLGPTSIDYEDGGRSLSSETRALVEQEVCQQVALPCFT